MTLAATNLRNDASGAGHGTGTYTTGSFTPSNNSLLCVALYVMTSGEITDPSGDLTITDSAGLTWTRRAFVGHPGGWSIGCVIWTAPVTTGASMTLTYDAGAHDIYAYYSTIRGYTGYSGVGATAAEWGDGAPSGTMVNNGADSITMSAAPAATSELFGILGVDPSGAVTNDPDALCTTIFEFDGGGVGCSTQYRAPGSTSTAFGWDDVSPGASTTYKVIAAAIEITAAATTPLDVASVMGWWSVPDSASAVSQIDDLSPNGWHAVQATGGNQAALDTTTFTPDSLFFDGVDDYYTAASFAHTTDVITAISLFAFSSSDPYSVGGADGRVISIGANAGGADAYNIGYAGLICREGGNPTVRAQRNLTSMSSKYPVSLDTLMVVTSKYDGANHTIYVDGAAQTAQPVTGNFAADELIFGGMSGDPVNGNFRGHLVTAAVFSTALSDPDRVAIETYFSTFTGYAPPPATPLLQENGFRIQVDSTHYLVA